MLHKLLLFMVINCCWGIPAYSQGRNPESLAIVSNKMTTKKVYCLVYDASGNDSLSYLLQTVAYSKAGYALMQTKYLPDGTVAGITRSEYLQDSLEIKRSNYDGNDNELSSVFFAYNANGRLIRRKETDNTRQTSHAQVFKIDSIGHIFKDYSDMNGNEQLSGMHEYNNNWKKVKDTYYTPKGEVHAIFLTEYSNDTVITYSEKEGVKTLRTWMIYSADKRLLKESNYYQNTVKLWDANGLVEHFNKGDIKLTIYTYDKRGLLLEQFDTINGKPFAKLTFIYK